MDCLLRAHCKGIGLERREPYIKESKTSNIELLRLNEILWRVDERLRQSLEQKHTSKTWEIENGILKEFDIVLNSKNDIQHQLAHFGFDAQKDTLVYQSLLHRAEKGENPSLETLQKKKQHLAEYGVINANSKDSHLIKLLKVGLIRDNISLNRNEITKKQISLDM